MSLSSDLVKTTRLPADARLDYHAEGAANVIYKIVLGEEDTNGTHANEDALARSIKPLANCLPQLVRPDQNDGGDDSLDTTRSRHDFNGKLLRLRKERAHSTSALQALHEFGRYIVPLFEVDELIHSIAVKIEDDLLSRLNSELEQLEELNKRSKTRCGVYLRREAYGTMMDDMRHAQSSTSRVLELKPKWLLQSPDAPESARRCRTCALRAYRLAQQSISGPLSQSAGFCPLLLASQDKIRVSQTLRSKFDEEQIPAELEQHIVLYLVHSSLIQKLKQLQGSSYPIGVLNADAMDTGFLVAMTLRDCSLYLTVDNTGVTSARLGDLDVKSPTRMDHWTRVERELIDGGWYEKEISHGCQVSCALEGS